MARLRLRLGLVVGPEIQGRFGLRRFAQSAGVLSLSSIANVVRAIITAKLFAVTLGPSAVGVLAQLFNFSALMAAVLPLGLTSSVSKLVAENSDNREQLNRVVLTSSVLALGAGLVGAIVLAPAASPISAGLTGTSRYALPVLLLVWSFPLYNVGGVIGYFLQGLADIRRLTIASILTTAFAVLVLVPMTLAYGLTGAIAAVLITSLAQVLIYGFEFWRAYAARLLSFAGAAFSRRIAKELLGYGGILLISGVLSWAAVLIVRTLTIRTLGQSANGLYQVVFALSSQYITVFLTWMAAYVFPRIISESRSGKLKQLLNSGLRANLSIMVPILVVSIALREPLIRIFYSSAFVSAAPLVPVQVVGDYMRIVGWSFAISLFALGHARSHLLLVAAQNIVWVLLAAVLIPVWGLSAVPLSYAISFITYPLLGIGLVRYWIDAGPDRWGVLLAALGLACVIGSLAPFYIGVLLAPVLPAVVYVLNRRELRAA